MNAVALSNIASIQGTISSLNLQLDMKREELNRLSQALSELSNCQGDFHAKKTLCLEPELTSSSWYGELASDFDSLRENDVQGSYIEISDVQMDDAISMLEAKIQEVKQEIQILESSITAQQTMLSSLYARAKEASK